MIMKTSGLRLSLLAHGNAMKMFLLSARSNSGDFLILRHPEAMQAYEM